ncbi:L-asparaginase II [Agromyces flavus]|uniref:L-asparaginase II n=1 Tax=Agromyces flavus TaxID=589382 RepID=A0A1H1TUI4_9MICO|nr:asparaginase [Agromyces flavus]MCP2368352.1 L-asparaginase II [Agromyces flavus]GGI47814.1 asparaginase [Agromyces flavus]SDS63858.1 L-asparaginase II [Agromyces flavus]
MGATFPASAAAELAVVERGGFVESRHVGSAVVLAPGGDVARVLGDPAAPVLPRSSMKPFQAIAVMTSGVTLRGEDAAIATASHTGTPRHVALVRGLLARESLPATALRCPPEYPTDRASRDQLVRAGERPEAITMNCSGKHAAMLLACRANGWSLDDYLDPEHALQKRVLDVLERLTGERPVATVVDGCGAPVHALSLTGLARGIQKIASSSTSSPFALFREAAAVGDGVRSNGWAVAGPGRPDSVVIDRLGVFAKFGAEGVQVMAAPDGTTVALKMLDGSPRASAIVAARLLAGVGAIDSAAVDAVEPDLGLDVLGGGAVVGRIRATV